MKQLKVVSRAAAFFCFFGPENLKYQKREPTLSPSHRAAPEPSSMRKLKHHEEKLLRKACVCLPLLRLPARAPAAAPASSKGIPGAALHSSRILLHPAHRHPSAPSPPHTHPPTHPPSRSDFLTWKKEDNLRELKILRRYHIQRREDYVAYAKLAGMVTKLTSKLKQLPPDNALRVSATQALLDKLFRMGLVDTASSLAKAEALPASAFCRRRLPVVMVRLRMAETLREAVTLVEQGQVRVGPEPVTDPAFIVTRTLEDFVTWVDAGRVRRATAKYNDKLDDYELLGE